MRLATIAVAVPLLAAAALGSAVLDAQGDTAMVLSGRVTPGEIVWVINGSTIEDHLHAGLGAIPFCDHTAGASIPDPDGDTQPTDPGDGIFAYSVEPGGPCGWAPGDQVILNRWLGDYEPVITAYEPGTAHELGELPWSLGSAWPTSNLEPSPAGTPSPTPSPTASPSPSPTESPSPTPSPTASPSPEPTLSPTPEPTSTPTPSPTATPPPEPACELVKLSAGAEVWRVEIPCE